MRRRTDGMDLSDWQAHLVIDWAEARKAGVKFCYLKATESNDWVDPSYPTRRAECYTNDVIPGAYHFAHPKPGNARDEALHFLRTAKPKAGDMPPALDLEVNEHHMSEAELTVWVAEWFHVVMTRLKIKRAYLYTHYNLLRVPKGVALWASRYNDANPQPRPPAPFHTWAMWQFSNGRFGNPATIPGVGHVDINTIHRSRPWTRISAMRMPVQRKVFKETPIERLTRILASQVGYHEGRSNGRWNNVQKFSPAVPGLGWSQGQPWCCTFQSWGAMEAKLADYYPRTASVRAAEAWFKSRNQWSEYPAVGAWCIMGNGEHVGYVYGYDDTYVYTIEGNTNTNGSAEGDGVYRKKRRRRDPYVSGYGYPEIPGVRLRTADPHYYDNRK